MEKTELSYLKDLFVDLEQDEYDVNGGGAAAGIIGAVVGIIAIVAITPPRAGSPAPARPGC